MAAPEADPAPPPVEGGSGPLPPRGLRRGNALCVPGTDFCVSIRPGIGFGAGVGCGLGAGVGVAVPRYSQPGVPRIPYQFARIPGFNMLSDALSMLSDLPGMKSGIGCGVGVGYGVGIGVSLQGRGGGRFNYAGAAPGAYGGGAYGPYGGYGAQPAPYGALPPAGGNGQLEARVAELEKKIAQLEGKLGHSHSQSKPPTREKSERAEKSEKSERAERSKSEKVRAGSDNSKKGQEVRESKRRG
eukprot:tig00020553_g10664.t1